MGDGSSEVDSPLVPALDFDWVTPQADRDDSWSAVEELLATCYGGSHRGCFTRYDGRFLRERLISGVGFQPPLMRGIVSRKDGRLVAFVAAIPMPARCRGESRSITVVNLWCVRPEFRSTTLGATLIRRLIADCSAAGLADGALFTGRKLPYPPLGPHPNAVRVLDAARLVSIGLLNGFEQTPVLPELPGSVRIHSATHTDPATLLALFETAHATGDVTLRMDSSAALQRFAFGPGLDTWVVLDAASGLAVAWFSTYAKEIVAVDGTSAPVACLWTIGFRDDSSARAAVIAAICIGASGGHALIEFPNGVRLDDEDRLALAVRPGPLTMLHTYGSAERYRGLAIDLPLF